MKEYFGQLDGTHLVGHSVSLATMFGALVGLLPAFAAFMAVAYYALQIYESNTVKGLVKRWRSRRLTKRVTKLRAELRRLVPPPSPD